MRATGPGDVRALIELDATAFGWGPVEDSHVEAEREILAGGRGLLAFEGRTAVGSAVAFDMALTVPGPRSVEVAAVSFVAVLPTHRRRGVLTGLMRAQLEEMHERGVLAAILYASETPIYGRYGYGVATWESRLEIERARARFVRPAAPGAHLRHVPKDGAAAVMAPLWDRVRRTRPGMVGVGPQWWREMIADETLWREGMTEPRFVACEVGGEEGCLVHRLKADWTDGQPAGRLEVLHLVATGDSAYAALWRFCLEMDLVSTVVARRRPPSEPLRLLLADARAVRAVSDDGLWLRLVDVPGALEARGYEGEGTLILAVRDPFCPWNEGVYELRVEAGRASCRPTQAGPQVAAGADALGAVYLGGNPVSDLAVAGGFTELAAGGLARAGQIFKSTSPPWSAFGF
ncbi:MAG: GNAT family N-acetyltransferase [Candidatus Dormibacterales bacterium]